LNSRYQNDWIADTEAISRKTFAMCTVTSDSFWVESSAQVRLVQITDPHLFDEEPEAWNNRKALAARVKKINERVDAGFN
jgi:hypothetical protein